ncbi:unnamed protein product [Miscanthus lutarioriparius]|uniref:Uncharacterized protein n=1 Tax=Miscanthus lutarioriparius TaxID=422564 RepID=A0A811SHK6_9POAL|nr:unnamed protein product [Miscanthus lutarioriparius]
MGDSLTLKDGYKRLKNSGQKKNKNSREKKRGRSSFLYPQPQQQNKNSLGFLYPQQPQQQNVPQTTTITGPKKHTRISSNSWIRWEMENHHLEACNLSQKLLQFLQQQILDFGVIAH